MDDAPRDATEDDGFLPPRELRDNPAAPAAASRTVALWLVLLAMFIAIYALFSDAHGAALARDIARVVWPFVLVGAVFTWLFRSFRGGTEFMHRLEPARTAMGAGQLERAGALFTGVVDRYRAQPTYAAAARLFLATTQLRRGLLAEATDTLLTVERGRGLLGTGDARAQAAATLAYVLALRGDLDAAAGWLQSTEQRLRRVGPASDRSHLGALRTLAAITIAARRGQLDEAARTFDAAAPHLEAIMTVSAMKAAWAVRGFAAARWTGPRDVGAAEPWLRHLRGARADEIDYLGAGWPEMQAFLTAAR